VRRLLLVIYWGAAAFLIPWILVLLRTQRPVVYDYHSRLLWLAIGVVMLGALVVTGILCWTSSRYVVVTATFTGTFLFIGAWFGVLTSTGLLQKVLVGFAVVLQFPVTILSLVIAYRMTRQRTNPRELSRVVPVAFLVGAVLMIPSTLRRIARVAPIHLGLHQRVAWSGLDVLELAGLLWTGWCVKERSPWLAMAATATGTLLFSDALYNIVTSKGSGFLAGVVMAVIAELPLAALSYRLAIREIGTWASQRDV
jgi:hypothetical protein